MRVLIFNQQTTQQRRLKAHCRRLGSPRFSLICSCHWQLAKYDSFQPSVSLIFGFSGNQRTTQQRRLSVIGLSRIFSRCWLFARWLIERQYHCVPIALTAIQARPRCAKLWLCLWRSCHKRSLPIWSWAYYGVILSSKYTYLDTHVHRCLV